MKFFIKELKCEEDIPGGSAVKTLPASRRPRFDPWVGKIPWRRKWQPCLQFLPGNSHRQRSLAGYSPWSLKESETTEHVEMKATNVNTNALKKQFKIRRCKFQRTIGI